MNQWTLNQRYQLQKRLSKKGTRHTFIAKDLHTHQPVVVKVLLFGPGFQWQDHKLFERGAAALKTLSFAGIPNYLDYFDVEIGRHKGFAQVQTYVPAKSLQQHIQAGRTFSEDELRQLALELLKILDYLHQRQPAVIHRDIKPSNILLEDRTGNHVGQVHLVDFDSVKTGATKSDHTMTIVGTYGYMPPEQFGGHARPASDLYSLGATLIYAASGKHPADLPQKDLAIDFESHVSLSANLVTWLKSITTPNLDRRLAAADQAIQALVHSCAAQTLPSRSATIQLPTRPVSSNIMVSQSNQVLEILIPPRGLQPMLVIAFLFIGAPLLAITLLMFLGVLVAIASGEIFGALFFLLFSLPVALPASLIVIPLVMSIFQQVQLRIDQDTITELYKLIGTRRRSVARTDVQLIDHERMSGVHLKTPTTTFALPATTPEEREWLVTLLSQWLQIPAKQITKVKKESAKAIGQKRTTGKKI